MEGYEGKRFSGLSGRLRIYLERRAVGKALRRLPKGSRILDLPCGTGRFASLLLKKADQLVEADISQEMIQFARKRRNLERGIVGFVRCDAEALPFRDGAFDCVLCFRFLPTPAIPFPRSPKRWRGPGSPSSSGSPWSGSSPRKWSSFASMCR